MVMTSHLTSDCLLSSTVKAISSVLNGVIIFTSWDQSLLKCLKCRSLYFNWRSLAKMLFLWPRKMSAAGGVENLYHLAAFSDCIGRAFLMNADVSAMCSVPYFTVCWAFVPWPLHLNCWLCREPFESSRCAWSEISSRLSSSVLVWAFMRQTGCWSAYRRKHLSKVGRRRWGVREREKKRAC